MSRGIRGAPRKTRRDRAEEQAAIDRLSRRPAGDTFGGDYHMAPPQPAYIPRPPAPAGDQPVLREDPLDFSVPVPPSLEPLIGDAIPAPGPYPEPEPEQETAPGTEAVLYSGPGWAFLPTAQRIAELDEMDLLVERGLGQNAAETATAFRHSRQRISAGVRQLCAEVGQPEMAGVLLRRVAQMNAQARQGTGPQRRVFHGGPPTGPRPAADREVLERVHAGLRDAS